MSNEPSDGVSDVPCRFGCEGAVGIYLVPKGCVCWDDPVQALCQQHALKAQSEGPITLIARPFGVRPSDGGEWNAELHEAWRELKNWLQPVEDSIDDAEERADYHRAIDRVDAALKRPPLPVGAEKRRFTLVVGDETGIKIEHVDDLRGERNAALEEAAQFFEGGHWIHGAEIVAAIRKFKRPSNLLVRPSDGGGGVYQDFEFVWNQAIEAAVLKIGVMTGAWNRTDAREVICRAIRALKRPPVPQEDDLETS